MWDGELPNVRKRKKKRPFVFQGYEALSAKAGYFPRKTGWRREEKVTGRKPYISVEKAGIKEGGLIRKEKVQGYALGDYLTRREKTDHLERKEKFSSEIGRDCLREKLLVREGEGSARKDHYLQPETEPLVD